MSKVNSEVLFPRQHNFIVNICVSGAGGKTTRNYSMFSWTSYYCFQQRPPVDEVLREGHINLSGLQLRAHAMFSAEGLPLGSDSLEYAWLIDVQTGNLTAKVTAPQVGSPTAISMGSFLHYCLPAIFFVCLPTFLRITVCHPDVHCIPIMPFYWEPFLTLRI